MIVGMGLSNLQDSNLGASYNCHEFCVAQLTPTLLAVKPYLFLSPFFCCCGCIIICTPLPFSLPLSLSLSLSHSVSQEFGLLNAAELCCWLSHCCIADSMWTTESLWSDQILYEFRLTTFKQRIWWGADGCSRQQGAQKRSVPAKPRLLIKYFENSNNFTKNENP